MIFLYNSAYASLSRGKIEMAIASALASVAQTLSRFSMDICLYMSAEFRFIDFPDEYITGSSIMPQNEILMYSNLSGHDQMSYRHFPTRLQC
jgi:argininosuccinate lyase